MKIIKTLKIQDISQLHFNFDAENESSGNIERIIDIIGKQDQERVHQLNNSLIGFTEYFENYLNLSNDEGLSLFTYGILTTDILGFEKLIESEIGIKS